jgi:hypothetical protein
MIPYKRISTAVPLFAVLVALSFPGAAGARAGDKTIQQTFPVATLLCAKVAAGTENRHLKKFATQVTADCAALQMEFTTAQTQVLAARAAILPTLTADRTAVRAACPNPKVARGACRAAHRADDAVIHALALQLHAASHAYYTAIIAARAAFWNAISALPGQKHIHRDKPIDILPD